MTKNLESEISSDWIRKNADLSRLKLTDEEISELVPQLGQILDYVDQLKKLETEQTQPWIHPLAELLPDSPLGAFRLDVEASPEELLLSSNRVLEAAPQVVERAFQVPEAVSQGGGRPQ